MSSEELAITGRLREERDQALLCRAAPLLAAELSLAELFERLCEMLANYVDASVVFIALEQPDGSYSIEHFHDHGVFRRAPRIPLSEGSRSLEVIRTGRAIWGNRPEQWAGEQRIPINADRPETDDTTSAIFVPLQAGPRVTGVLSVQSTQADAYDQGEVDVIAAIAHYLAVAVENQRMYRALLRTADFDPLTGLVSHSRLLRELDALVAGANPERPPVAVMLNITNFTMFNDTYGSAEGDTVLRSVAGTLNEFSGRVASIGRYGGDVFMVLLAPQPKEQSIALIENIVKRCRGLSYQANSQAIPVSLACGYAFVPDDASTRSELLALCTHRTRLSRKQGGEPIGPDQNVHHIHGDFRGIEAIVETLLDRDPYTRVHLFHANAIAKEWAECNLRLSDADYGTFLQVSLLHDVGKLLISDRILVKPGRLTAEEYLAIQHHARFGRDILAPHERFRGVAEIVGQHHERWDGRGYPLGLKGRHVHPLARATSILDAFSAMVMDRPYHRGVTEAEALGEIQRCAGTQFDPELAERFLAYRRS